MGKRGSGEVGKIEREINVKSGEKAGGGLFEGLLLEVIMGWGGLSF